MLQLRKYAKFRCGYVLQSYSKSFLSPEEIRKLYTRLQRVPAKISAHFERETIKSVFKYTEFTYFVVDTDNNTYILDY